MKNNSKVIRAKMQMSQAELAQRSGVSRATISAIEKGRAVPHGYTMLDLSNTAYPVGGNFL